MNIVLHCQSARIIISNLLLTKIPINSKIYSKDFIRKVLIFMKIFIGVLICKVLYFIGKRIGRGSSLPGKVVLKIFPDILSCVKLPKTVIAVSGSNGKTSTVEMIAHVMQANGTNVIWNKEGANQIEGVTTFLLNNADLKGNISADAVLLESDERYARLTFKYVVPTHFVITNLYRDQMTRNAHSEWIYNILKDAVKPESILVLNADDPLVSCFAIDHDPQKVVYYSMDKNKYSTSEPVGVYNDGKYCPVCKSQLEYEYYNMAHIGKYICKNCGHKTNDAPCKVTDMDLDAKTVTFDNEYVINLSFSSAFNVYNLLATFTIATVLGYSKADVATALNGYILKSGRIIEIASGNHKGLLLTSKHENSVSYNQSIDYVVRRNNDCIVMVLVDAISRKYYTGETSWLFDIDFDRLNCDNVKNIVLCGKYAYDLAVRFEFTGIDNRKITVEPDITKALDVVCNVDGDAEFYAITCFSDKDKILTRLNGGKA